MGVMQSMEGFLQGDKCTGVSLATGAVVALGLMLVYRKVTRKRMNLPPGPSPLPLVGSIIELYRQKDTLKYLRELRDEYGDVYIVYAGTLPVVFLNTAELVREAYIRKGDTLSGRPQVTTLNIVSSYGKDIILGQPTELWKAQRKIMHGALRKYASGEHLEALVSSAIDKVATLLERHEPDEPVDIERYISLLFCNITLTMTLGKEMDLEDEFFCYIKSEWDELNDMIGGGLAADYIPILRFIPTPTFRKIKSVTKHMMAYLGTALREHRDTYNPESVTDFTYHLLEMKQEVEEEETNVLSQMTEQHMLYLMFDLFIAGMDTSRITLAWLVQYLAMYPEVQDKVRTEVQHAIGSRRQVKAADRDSLSYTYSVIHEVLRLRPIIPFLIPHVATADTTLGTYDIPAGTVLTANVMNIHRDPREWEDPEEFKPERFLDSDGQFLTRPGWLPFSTGKRVCVGESLAKVEILMIVAQLIRRFSFHPCPGESLTAQYKPNVLQMRPKPFRVVIKPVDN